MIRIVIAFVVSLFFAFAAHAASLRIDSGGSAAGGHEEEIDVISVEWKGAAPRGKSGPGTVTIVVPVAKGDVDGRDFLVWQRSGQMIPSMTLTTEENGKTVQYKLSRCFVKSWSTSGDADDRPTDANVGGNETVTIGFAKSETVG